MNVLELLNQELHGKTWSMEEKAYYIYLRGCQLFSYDPRYDFRDLISNGDSLKREILNRTIDLENVYDNQVVCTSYAREVISPLLRQLLNIDVREKGGLQHAWVQFSDGKRDRYVDATTSFDFARVKMGLNTYGYQPVIKNYDFHEELKTIAKQIHYIEDEYRNYFIEKRGQGLFEEFRRYSYPSMVEMNSDDYRFYQVYTIKELFEGFDNMKNFSDAKFCISYLIRNFLPNDFSKVFPVSLFENPDNEHWNFIKIYPIPLLDDKMYFILEKIEDSFCFHEITKSDAENYVKTLNGRNKGALYS